MVDPTITRVWSIYKITCRASGKSYIGLTCSPVNRRWNDHASAAIRKTSRSRMLLHRAIRKYGKDNFTVETVATCRSLPEASTEERRLIGLLSTRRPHGYNLADGGMGTPGVRNKHTPETRAKMSGAHMGKTFSAESRRRMSESWKGRVVTQEWIANAAKARTGLIPTPEHRRAVSIGRTGIKVPRTAIKMLEKALAQIDSGACKNFRPEYGKFSTRIGIGQKRRHLGVFPTKEEAIAAYRRAVVARLAELRSLISI